MYLTFISLIFYFFRLEINEDLITKTRIFGKDFIFKVKT